MHVCSSKLDSFQKFSSVVDYDSDFNKLFRYLSILAGCTLGGAFFFIFGSLLPVEKERYYYRLIGIFWLRTGDDRLDVLPVCGVDPQLCGVLRCGSGFDTLDDNGRIVLPGAQTRRHVYCCAGQLDGEFPRWNRIP